MPKHKKTIKRTHFIKRVFWIVLGISFFLWILALIANRQKNHTLSNQQNIVPFRYSAQNKTIAQYHCKPLQHTHYWSHSSAKIIEFCTYTNTTNLRRFHNKSSIKPSNFNSSVKSASATNHKMKLINRSFSSDNNIILTFKYNKKSLYVHIHPDIQNSPLVNAFIAGDFYQLANLLRDNIFNIQIYQNDINYKLLDFAAKEGIDIIVDAILNSNYFNPDKDSYLDAVENTITYNQWNTLVLFIDKIPILADIDYVNNVFLFSCYQGNLDILKQLISHQYFTMDKLVTRLSAIAIAIAKKKSNIIDYLYSEELIEQYRNISSGQNILHYILTDFIEPGTNELNLTGKILIQYLIKKNPMLLFDTDHAGKTPLRYAIDFGYTKIAAFMENEIKNYEHANQHQNLYLKWLKNKLTINTLFKVSGFSLMLSLIIYGLHIYNKKHKTKEIYIENAIIQLNKLTKRLLTSSWEYRKNNAFQINLTFYSASELASIFKNESKYKAVTNQLNIDHNIAIQILVDYIKDNVNECSIMNDGSLIILTFNKFEDLCKLQLSPIFTSHPIYTRFYFQSREFQNYLLNELNILTQDFSSTTWQTSASNIYTFQPQLYNSVQLADGLKGHPYNSITLSSKLFIELLSETIKSALHESVLLNQSQNQLTFQLVFNNFYNLTLLNKSFKNVLAQKVIMNSDEHKETCDKKAKDEELQQKTIDLIQLHQELVDYLQRFNDFWVKQPLHRDFDKIINQFDRPGIKDLNSPKMTEYIRNHIHMLKNYKTIYDQAHNNAFREIEKIAHYFEQSYPNEDISKLDNIALLSTKLASFKETLNYYRNYLASLNQAVHIIIENFNHDNLKGMKKRNTKPDLSSYIKNSTTSPLPKLSITTVNSTNKGKNVQTQNTNLIPIEPPISISSSAQSSTPFSPKNDKTTLPSSRLLNLFTTQQNTTPHINEQQEMVTQPNPLDSQVDDLFQVKYGTLDDIFLINSDPKSCISSINYYIQVIQTYLCNGNIDGNQLAINKIKLFVKSLCLKAYLLYGLDEALFVQIPYHDILKRGFENIYNPISNGLNDQFNIRDHEIIDFCKYLCKQSLAYQQQQQLQPLSLGSQSATIGTTPAT